MRKFLIAIAGVFAFVLLAVLIAIVVSEYDKAVIVFAAICVILRARMERTSALILPKLTACAIRLWTNPNASAAIFVISSALRPARFRWFVSTMAAIR